MTTHRLKPNRRRIPARYGWIVMPLVLSIVMTCLVSGISTLQAIGLAPDLHSRWLSAWVTSWLVAFPALLVVLPLVRRIVAAVVAPD